MTDSNSSGSSGTGSTSGGTTTTPSPGQVPDAFQHNVQNAPVNNTGGGTGTGSGSNNQNNKQKTGHYDADRGGFVTDDGKFYPTSNPNFTPNGYSSSNSKIKQGPANGQTPAPVTKTTSGETIHEVAPGIYATSSGRIISTYEAKNDPALEEFLKKNPPLAPGIYNENLMVYQGKKTRDYTAKDVFQNPTLIDNYVPRTITPRSNIPAPNTEFQQNNSPTVRALKFIDQEGNGPFAGQPRNTNFEPHQDSLSTYAIQSLETRRVHANENAEELFATGGTYPIAGGIINKGASFSTAIILGGVKGATDVKTNIVNIGSGFLVGGTERGLAIGARSTNTAVASGSKVGLQALPIVNFALAGAYAVERGYHGAQAFEEGRLGDFIGETGVQVATFGIGYGAAKTIIAPKTLIVSGEPVGLVKVEGFGRQEYTGTGQEVNAPTRPPIVKRTIYTEKAEGYLGYYGDVRTTVTETPQGRFTVRDIGGTTQAPKYRYIEITRNTPEGRSPSAEVLAYKNGILQNKGQTLPESFDKFQATSQDTTTTAYRNSGNPDKSILTQAAGSERIITIKQDLGSKEITGSIGVGTEAQTVSFTKRGKFEARRTAIERTATEGQEVTTNVGKSEKLLAGTTKVQLKVAEESPRNEFSQSANRLVQERPIEVTITEEGTVAVDQKGAYAANLKKPFIETAGQKTVSIGGTIEIKPQELGTVARLKTALKIGARKAVKPVENAIEAPIDLGESAFIQTTKKVQEIKTKRSNKNARQITTTDPGASRLISESTSEVTRLQAPPAPDVSFDLPKSAQKQQPKPASISGSKPESAIRPAISSVPKYDSRSDASQVQRSTQVSRVSQVTNPAQTEEPDILQIPRRAQRPTSATHLIPATTIITETKPVVTLTPATEERSQATFGPKEPQRELPTPQSFGGSKKETDLFDVQVKRFGKFYRFNTQGLRVQDAVKLGERIADTTAAVSFKITPTGSSLPIQGRARQEAEDVLQKNKFSTSKRDANIFVEKNSARIDSIGEKQEIRPKGPFTNPNKRRRTLWV